MARILSPQQFIDELNSNEIKNTESNVNFHTIKRYDVPEEYKNKMMPVEEIDNHPFTGKIFKKGETDDIEEIFNAMTNNELNNLVLACCYKLYENKIDELKQKFSPTEFEEKINDIKSKKIIATVINNLSYLL